MRRTLPRLRAARQAHLRPCSGDRAAQPAAHECASIRLLPGIGAALLNALCLGSPLGYAILFLPGARLTALRMVLVQQNRGVR